MYQLIGIDTVMRIAAAFALLFIVVPRAAWRPTVARDALERFWWNLGIGTILLTVSSQILTLLHLNSAATLLLACFAVILFSRAHQQQVRPGVLLRRWWDMAFLALLNVAEGRVNLRRRLQRSVREWRMRIDARFRSRPVRLAVVGWLMVVGLAALFRFYRPMVSANLGFSDTYVHLYLLKLLQQGRQVDPDWGPYPRGMHFLLLAVRQLTNVDEIALMNFFGAFVGVLIVISVADAARRVSGRLAVGVVAGILFATFAGGPRQYFALGGAFASTDPAVAKQMLQTPYAPIEATGAEFDVAFIAFQRQTATLSQEVAVVFLLPAVMFLLAWLRGRDRWHLAGFFGCTASLAAAHSGVVVPLLLLCTVAALALFLERSTTFAALRRAVGAGALAVVVGSLWVVAFIAYPYAGRRSAIDAGSHVGSTALYYFPLLRSILRFEHEPSAAPLLTERTYVALTPFLIIAILGAVALAVSALARRERNGGVLWASLSALLLLLVHFASRLHLPEIIQTHRNVEWLLMLLAIVLAMLLCVPLLYAAVSGTARRVTAAVVCAVLIAWVSRAPRLDAAPLHERLTSYSGYGATALAVMQIERNLEPFSWTLVSYGQEFPMVLRRGFHLPAADFLDRYDPASSTLAVPTPFVFIVVERVPHRFQVNDWKSRFDRREIEERLQTWCTLYQLTHRDMRITYDDGRVRVYAIERDAQALASIQREMKR